MGNTFSQTDADRLYQPVSPKDPYLTQSSGDTRYASLSSLNNYYTKLDVDSRIKQIQIPSVDLSNYYKKPEIDTKLSSKVDSSSLSGYALKSDIPSFSNYYSKTDIDSKLNTIPSLSFDASNYYTKPDTDSKLNSKADISSLTNYALKSDVPDISNYYTKTDTDSKLSSKADTTQIQNIRNDLYNTLTQQFVNADAFQNYTNQAVNQGIGKYMSSNDAANMIATKLSSGQDPYLTQSAGDIRYIKQGSTAKIDPVQLAGVHSDLYNTLSNQFLTQTLADGRYQPRGNYLESNVVNNMIQSQLGNYMSKQDADTYFQPIGQYLTVDQMDRKYQSKGNYQPAENVNDPYLTTSSGDAKYQAKGQYPTFDQMSTFVNQNIGTYDSNLGSKVMKTVQPYLSQANYITKNIADNDYAPKQNYAFASDLQQNYLSKSEARQTYQPLGNYASIGDIAAQINQQLTDKQVIKKQVADATYQPLGNYLVKSDTDQLYQPKGEYPTFESLQYLLSKDQADTMYQPLGVYTTPQDVTYTASNLVNQAITKGNYMQKSLADSLYQPKGNYLQKSDTDQLYQIKGNYQTAQDPTNPYLTQNAGDNRYLQQSSTDPYIRQSQLSSSVLTPEQLGTALNNYVSQSQLQNYYTKGDILNLNYATKNNIADAINAFSSSEVKPIIDSSLQTILPTYLSTYPTKEEVQNEYQPKGNYMTLNGAVQMFVQKGDPNSGYVSLDQANNTYQSKGNYMTLEQASNQFQPKGNYLTLSDTDNVYQTKGDYISKSELSNYITKADATALIGSVQPTSTPAGSVDTSQFITRQEVNDSYILNDPANPYVKRNELSFNYIDKAQLASSIENANKDIEQSVNTKLTSYLKKDDPSLSTYLTQGQLDNYVTKTELPIEISSQITSQFGQQLDDLQKNSISAFNLSNRNSDRLNQISNTLQNKIDTNSLDNYLGNYVSRTELTDTISRISTSSFNSNMYYTKQDIDNRFSELQNSLNNVTNIMNNTNQRIQPIFNRISELQNNVSDISSNLNNKLNSIQTQVNNLSSQSSQTFMQPPPSITTFSPPPQPEKTFIQPLLNTTTFSPPPQPEKTFIQPLPQTINVPFSTPSTESYSTFREVIRARMPDGTTKPINMPPAATPGPSCMVGSDSLFVNPSKYVNTPTPIPEMNDQICESYSSIPTQPVLTAADCPPGFMFTEDCRYFNDPNYPTGERKLPACVYKGPINNGTETGMCTSTPFGHYTLMQV